MLLINFSDGSAVTIDLKTDEGNSGWFEKSNDPEFHKSVRGISLSLNGHRTDLPLPKRFKNIIFNAELIRNKEGKPVAERVSAIADDIVLSLTMYLNGRSGRFRVDLDKRGKIRYRPVTYR